MKVFLRTFGCRANQYDTETVRAMVLAAGHEVVATPDGADVAVFNSCAVTAAAEADLRRQVRRAGRAHPALRSVVMGCASALPTAPALRALPTVEAVVPGADFGALAGLLGLDPVAVRAAEQSGTRALLRVQDGCDEHCTFCATTLARGAHRSRPAAELVEEARALATRHPEIVVTGIHIGSYGADTGSTLGALVQRLVEEVPAARFRLSSIEATEVDDRLTELLAGAPGQVAPHLHAPLQSGSDAVLKRMGRHWYTAARYAEAIERLAARTPLLALGADVIAGFPGESEADHRATVAIVEALPFTYLHVFPYSVRPGTAAARLPGHLPSSVIQERARELRAIGETKAAAHRARRDRTPADVVTLGGTSLEGREGLTEDYLSVAVTDRGVGRGVRLRATLALRADGVLLAGPTQE